MTRAWLNESLSVDERCGVVGPCSWLGLEGSGYTLFA